MTHVSLQSVKEFRSLPEALRHIASLNAEIKDLTEEINILHRRLGAKCYGIRLHDRMTENDPHTGTVMYSTRGPEGPWFDMVTGDTDWCNEVLDALIIVDNMKLAERSLD